METAVKIQWGLTLLAALVIEVVLFAVLIPIGVVFGMEVFVIAVPVGVFLVSCALTILFSRRIRSRLLLHGFLIGVFATVLYLALVILPGNLSTALETYGAPIFILGNGLRIAGTVLGAWIGQRNRTIIGSKLAN